ncbi:MAG: hypothetical protein FWD22_07040, partial [Treponema sp.]|nr:hypothetical protein [Treponema sp.]
LFAQDDSVQPGYFIDYGEEEPRFVQYLVWDSVMYVLHYEVELEIHDGTFKDYFSETTKENFIKLSLPPGRYRYRVTTFDLLGRRSETSDWTEIRVNAAFQPEIIRIIPEAFFMDQRQDRILFIAGNNIFDESIIYLRDGDTYVFPIERSISGNSRIRLVFDDLKLIPGEYDIHIENPGGLEIIYNGFIIGYRKPLDIFIRLAASPAVPIYGELKDLFGSKLFLPGLSYGFEAISSKRSTFNGGIELAASSFFINPALTIAPSVYDFFYNLYNAGNGASFSCFNINIALQKRYFQMRNAVTVRFGVGVGMLNGYGSYDRSEAFVNMNLGLTGYFLMYDIFHVEVGVDYSHFGEMSPFGLIMPRLGLVWKI